MAMDDYLDWYDLSEEKKLCQSETQGNRPSMALEDKMARLGQTLVSTSEEMKLKLKEQYLPVEYEQIMYNKLLQLKQGCGRIDFVGVHGPQPPSRVRAPEVDIVGLTAPRHPERDGLY